MKKVICLVASLGFLINAEAQYSSKMKVQDFNAIEVSSSARVYLYQSDSNYVVLDTLGKYFTKAKTPKMEVKNGVLEISSPFRGKVEVHVKNISSINVSAAGSLESKDTLNTNNLTIHVSDAGHTDIWVHAKTIKIRANDAGFVAIGGTVDSLDAHASDASGIHGKFLKAGTVRAISSDGSNISVWAVKNIDAKATDGSNITIKGSPTQKSTSAEDGGSVKMEATGEETTPDYCTNGDKMDKDSTKHKKHLEINDAFIGGGFVTGGTQSGAPIKYGASREFIVGFGKAYKIVKWNFVGIDFYYKSTDFYLNEDSAKTFPNKILHNQEKISTQNFGGLVYDRFYFGKKDKIFLDGGIYGDWIIHSKYITRDNNTPDAASTKIIQRNLSFVNPLDYGLTFRFGSNAGLSVYFNYRLSNLFQNTPAGTPAYPEMPAYTIGINIGGF